MAKPSVSIYVTKDEREVFLKKKDELVNTINSLKNVIGDWSVSRLLRAVVLESEVMETSDGVFIRFKVANK